MGGDTNIGLNNDTFSEPQTSPIVMTSSGAINSFMLRLDLRGRTGELYLTKGTGERNSNSPIVTPKLIRTGARTSYLASMLQPYRISIVGGDANGTFTLYLPSLDNLYTRGSRGFMGKAWDGWSTSASYQRWCKAWAEGALRILKPGGHLLAFGGTRTYHRLACAIEDAGFEIRDCLSYMYGSGFPKSLNLDRLRGEQTCGCEPEAEHDLRTVRDADVPPPVPTEGGEGPLLLAGVPESSAPADGAVSAEGRAGSAQRGMEGRRDVQADARQPRGSALRESADVGAGDGTQGRLRDGASADRGATGTALAHENGSGASPRPRPTEQRADESGAVARQPDAQARGAWPTCGRCGLPVVPRGLGTALKPSWEPIILARKPLSGTVARTVLEHGTGALNIDGCRIKGTDEIHVPQSDPAKREGVVGTDLGITGADQERFQAAQRESVERANTLGRWPANTILSHLESCRVIGEKTTEGRTINRWKDGAKPFGGGAGHPFSSEKYPDENLDIYDCAPDCPVRLLDEQTGNLRSMSSKYWTKGGYSSWPGPTDKKGSTGLSVEGGASRFFYCAKASRKEREIGLEDLDGKRKNNHPTVKPIKLMQYLCRLITPPGGLILDPFLGSGTTGIAAILEGFDFIGIEKEDEYCKIAKARIEYWDEHRSDS